MLPHMLILNSPLQFALVQNRTKKLEQRLEYFFHVFLEFVFKTFLKTNDSNIDLT